MSSTPVTNLFKRVRPAGRVGLNTMGTSIPKQRVQYSMRHAKNKKIKVFEAAKVEKLLRKQLYRRQPSASVSARRDEIRQQDILRRRTIHFSMDTRLPSFSRAGKLSKFTSVSDQLATLLASEMRIRKIIIAELSAVSPDINTALHAAVKIQQGLELFDIVSSVADIFVTCLRKDAPALFLLEEHTLKAVKDWDFFRSMYNYLTTEAEWGRLRDDHYKLYKVVEHVVAFTKLKIGFVKFSRFMDLSEYRTCGPDPVDTEMVDADVEDYSIPGGTHSGLNMAPITSSSATPPSGTVPPSVLAPPTVMSSLPVPAQQSGLSSHAKTKFQICISRPLQSAPAQAALASQPSLPSQQSAASFHSGTSFASFGSPKKRAWCPT